MADFGLSVKTGGVGIENIMTHACGTLIYMGKIFGSPAACQLTNTMTVRMNRVAEITPVFDSTTEGAKVFL